MRLVSKLVHPSIFKAVDGVMFDRLTPKNAKVVGEYQSLWFKENGAAFFSWIVGGILAVVGAVALVSGMPKGVRLLTAFGTLFSVVIAAFAFYGRKGRPLSLGQLETALPLLDLTETQRAYAQTLVAMGSAGRGQEEMDETMRTLNALIDEEARLTKTRESLTGTEDRDERAHLGVERERLALRASDAQDESTRTALEQSLSLLDERVRNLDGGRVLIERVDAHLELLRQAVLATRDAARRLSGGAAETAPDLATDALRSAVSLARAQTQATEVALAELRAI